MIETIDRPITAVLLSRFQWFRQNYKGFWLLIEVDTPKGKKQRWVNHVWQPKSEERLGRVMRTERYKYDWEQ